MQAHYTYDDFGNTVSQTGAMTADFNFRFSSKYLDDETGLYYYGYRYMSPALGRWVSRDPVWERGGFLLSGFVENDLVNKVDVSGFMSYDPRRNRQEAAPGELFYDPDWEWEGTGNQSTFEAVELQLVLFGGGFSKVTCCDEKLRKWVFTYFKWCVGAAVGVNYSTGIVNGMDGKDCYLDKYKGWFFELGGSFGPFSVGGDMGYEDMLEDDPETWWPPLPGDHSDVLEVGGGIGKSPKSAAIKGFSGKGTWCRYTPIHKVQDGCCEIQ